DPHEGDERPVEGVEVLSVTAPVEGLEVLEPAQRLRRHRALHRVEAALRRPERREVDPRGLAVGQEGTSRITEVPGDVVEVAEHVTSRTRDVAVPGRDGSLVQELP